MIERVDLPDVAAMERFGRRIAGVLQVGYVIALSGSLGAGKTTLARAILAGTGYAGEVPSPTFTIMELYEPPATRLPVIHADFYRLNSADEVEELGLASLRDDAVLLAEWPDKAGGFTHEPGCLGIELMFDGDGRTALLTRGTGWEGREF